MTDHDAELREQVARAIQLSDQDSDGIRHPYVINADAAIAAVLDVLIADANVQKLFVHQHTKTLLGYTLEKGTLAHWLHAKKPSHGGGSHDVTGEHRTA